MIRKKCIYLIPAILLFLSTLLFISSCVFRPYLYFWKIESNGKTIYLLGTIHAFKPELLDKIDRKIFGAFSSSDIVLIEKKGTGRKGRSYYEFALYPPDDNLQNHIPESYYKELTGILEENILEIEDYKLFRPFYFLYEMGKISQARYGYDDSINNGIDWYFLDKCVESGIPWDGLEYSDYQYELMEQEMSEEETGYYLVKSVQSRFVEDFGYEEAIEELIDHWIKGTYVLHQNNRKEKYEGYIEDSNDELTVDINKSLKKVNEKRNLNMADSIEEYIMDKEYKTVFAMAGVSHFIAEDSIIDILRDRGYKVKRIKRSFSWPF